MRLSNPVPIGGTRCLLLLFFANRGGGGGTRPGGGVPSRMPFKPPHLHLRRQRAMCFLSHKHRSSFERANYSPLVGKKQQQDAGSFLLPDFCRNTPSRSAASLGGGGAKYTAFHLELGPACSLGNGAVVPNPPLWAWARGRDRGSHTAQPFVKCEKFIFETRNFSK